MGKREESLNAIYKASSLAPTWLKPIEAIEKLLNYTIINKDSSDPLNTPNLDSLRLDDRQFVIEIDSIQMAKNSICKDHYC